MGGVPSVSEIGDGCLVPSCIGGSLRRHDLSATPVPLLDLWPGQWQDAGYRKGRRDVDIACALEK